MNLNTIKEVLEELLGSHDSPGELPGTYPRSLDPIGATGNETCMTMSEDDGPEAFMEGKTLYRFERLNKFNIEAMTIPKISCGVCKFIGTSQKSTPAKSFSGY